MLRRLNSLSLKSRQTSCKRACRHKLYVPLTYRTPDPDSEEGLIITQANTLITKYKAKFLTATDEETAISEYRKMVAELDAIGYDKVDKFNTEAHKEALARHAAYEEKIKNK